MGDKGLCRCAACNCLHHGCLDLDESSGVHVRTHCRDDLRPHEERLFHLRGHGEINVTLPVPRLHILQAMPFFRQGSEGFCQEFESLDIQADFSGSCLDRGAPKADDISHVKLLEQGICLLSDLCLLKEGLQLSCAVLKMDKGCLPKRANRHDSSSQTVHRGNGKELLRFLIAIGLYKISGVGVFLVRVGEMINTHLLFQLSEFINSLFNQAVYVFQDILPPRFCEIEGLYRGFNAMSQ